MVESVDGAVIIMIQSALIFLAILTLLVEA
jgi:hypothetical protein